MLTKFALAVAVLLAAGSTSLPECNGCDKVASNTVPLANLSVTFPTITKGTCVQCPSCAFCVEEECTATGTFQMCNVGFISIYRFRSKGSDGLTTLAPQTCTAPVVYTGNPIDCGNICIFDNWQHSLGQQWIFDPGSVQVGCSDCPGAFGH